MRIRAASVIGVGAFGFLLLLAGSSAADVADPRSPYQPAATGLVASSGEETTTQSGAPVEGSTGTQLESEDRVTYAPRRTAVPESVVRAVPAAQRNAAPAPAATDRAIQRIRGAFHQAGAFLGQVAGACKVGVAGGTGGPVLLLAVLSMATVLVGRRVYGARWLNDEEPPEFLYAWDVIAPG